MTGADSSVSGVGGVVYSTKGEEPLANASVMLLGTRKEPPPMPMAVSL